MGGAPVVPRTWWCPRQRQRRGRRRPRRRPDRRRAGGRWVARSLERRHAAPPARRARRRPRRRVGGADGRRRTLRRARSVRCLGVGVAVPGAVRAGDGLVRFAPNLGWSAEPFTELLARAPRAARSSPATTPTSACSPSTSAAPPSATPTSPTSAAASASVAASWSAGVPLDRREWVRRRDRAPAGRQRRPRRAGAATLGCWETKVGENELLQPGRPPHRRRPGGGGRGDRGRRRGGGAGRRGPRRGRRLDAASGCGPSSTSSTPRSIVLGGSLAAGLARPREQRINDVARPQHADDSPRSERARSTARRCGDDAPADRRRRAGLRAAARPTRRSVRPPARAGLTREPRHGAGRPHPLACCRHAGTFPRLLDQGHAAPIAHLLHPDGGEPRRRHPGRHPRRLRRRALLLPAGPASVRRPGDHRVRVQRPDRRPHGPRARAGSARSARSSTPRSTGSATARSSPGSRSTSRGTATAGSTSCCALVCLVMGTSPPTPGPGPRRSASRPRSGSPSAPTGWSRSW